VEPYQQLRNLNLVKLFFNFKECVSRFLAGENVFIEHNWTEKRGEGRTVRLAHAEWA